MAVFITGATGFIGSHLAKKLSEAGETVNALFRSSRKTSWIKNRNIRLFRGDVDDKASLLQAMAGCDRAYHLGAFARSWHRDPTIYHRVNVEGTLRVIESALESGIQRIVITSTAGVLGPSEGEPVNERTERVSAFFNFYESSKFEMEKRVRELEKGNLEVVVVNPTRVYGPGILNEANSLTKIVKAYLEGRWHIIPGKGDSIGNYAFIEDVVDGFVQAMSLGKSGERYILGGENKTFREFFMILSEVSGEKHWMVRLPGPVMLGAAGAAFLLARLVRRPPPVPPVWVIRYLKNCAVSSDKAKDKLRYKITPLEAGLIKTVAWLKSGEMWN